MAKAKTLIVELINYQGVYMRKKAPQDQRNSFFKPASPDEKNSDIEYLNTYLGQGAVRLSPDALLLDAEKALKSIKNLASMIRSGDQDTERVAVSSFESLCLDHAMLNLKKAAEAYQKDGHFQEASCVWQLIANNSNDLVIVDDAREQKEQCDISMRPTHGL